MSSNLLSRQDLDFLLYDWLEVQNLCDRPRFADHSRDTFDPAIDLAARIAEEQFATHNKKSDANEPQLVDGKVQLIPEIAVALKAFNQAGLIAGSMDYEVGGMQLPSVVFNACMAWFQAANPGTTSYPFLTVANINLLVAHGNEEQKATYVGPMTEGKFLGTMCLSETEAGSSLGDIATRAEPAEDGTYRLFGSKMWISAGEHDLSDNIVHLVLARVAGARAGVKGLSLFVVPKFLVNADGSLGEHNDVVCAGLNHKMGYRGTTNTVMNFGGGDFTPDGGSGAIGTLVGEAGRGLNYMFHMMNEARTGVGMGSVALGYTGYLKSVEYAKDRKQGRSLAAGAPEDPAVAIIEHSDVKRMLLAQKSYVEGGLALGLFCASLIDDEATHPDEATRQQAKAMLDVLTPVAKSWPSQWCLEANNLAIQVHGGYGYTRDYDVEQHYRDNRLNPIHEGTHGIQGLDLLGRKVVMNGGADLGVMLSRLRDTCAAAASGTEQAQSFAKQLTLRVDRVESVTAALWSAGDVPATLANASIYLEAFGHVIVSWVWLEQVLALTANTDSDFAAGKRQAAQYFFDYELPKTDAQFDLLESLNRTTLEMQPDWF